MFKAGDKLLCISWAGQFFKVGKVYTVSENLELRSEHNAYYNINNFTTLKKSFIIATPLNEALL